MGPVTRDQVFSIAISTGGLFTQASMALVMWYSGRIADQFHETLDLISRQWDLIEVFFKMGVPERKPKDGGSDT